MRAPATQAELRHECRFAHRAGWVTVSEADLALAAPAKLLLGDFSESQSPPPNLPIAKEFFARVLVWELGPEYEGDLGAVPA